MHSKESITGPKIQAVRWNTPGIYQILCTPTGKVYVGSATDLRNRWKAHIDKLCKGRHHNKYLQNAWNKYGPNSFEFSVLEFIEKRNLLEAKQRWIDKTNCVNQKIGFNIYKTAGSPAEQLAQKWEGLIDPNGNEVTIYNFESFCRKHNLSRAIMWKLAKGNNKNKACQGWTHKNSVRKRDYVKTYDGFISPDGKLVGPIINLAAFCRKNGLDNTHMVAVFRGRICSHRGWTYKTSRQRMDQKTYNGFINPNGQKITITNLAAFCRENNLQKVHMHELISGKRKQHKGWTWRNDNGQPC